MKQGDILYAKSLRFTAFAGKKEERKYNPWVDTTSNRNFLTYLIPGVGQVIGLVDFATGYQQYDDKELLTEHYGAMKSYISYILEKNIDPKTNLLTQEKKTSWSNLASCRGLLHP